MSNNARRNRVYNDDDYIDDYAYSSRKRNYRREFSEEAYAAIEESKPKNKPKKKFRPKRDEDDDK